MPPKATIDGQPIPPFDGRIVVSVTPPHDERGFRDGPAAVRVRLERDLKKDKDVDMAYFNAAARDPKRISGKTEIKFLDSAGNEAYVFDLKRAFTSRYKFTISRGKESIDLYAGQVELTGGGDSASFDLGNRFELPD